MVFPLTESSTNQSLLANLTQSVGSSPPNESPRLAKLFAHLNRLVAKTKMNPGTLAEAGSLVKILKPMGSLDLSPEEQKVWSVFKKTIIDLHLRGQLNEVDLDSALSQAYPQMPEYDAMMEDLTELIMHGHLPPPPLAELNEMLKRHYQQQFGESQQGDIYLRYFRDWYARCEREQLQLAQTNAPQLEQFRQFARNLIDQAREKYGSTQCVDRLTNCRADSLHDLRCSLIEEAFLAAEIEEIIDQMERGFQRTSENARSSREVIPHLNEIVEAWIAQRNGVLNEADTQNPLLLSLSVQVKKEFEEVDARVPYWMQSPTLENIDSARVNYHKRSLLHDRILQRIALTEKSCSQDAHSQNLLKGIEIEKQFYTLQKHQDLLYHFLCKVLCLFKRPRNVHLKDQPQIWTHHVPIYIAIGAFTNQMVRDYQSIKSSWQHMARLPVIIVEFLSQCLDLFRQHQSTQSHRFEQLSHQIRQMTDRRGFPKFQKVRLSRCAVPLTKDVTALPDAPTLEAMRNWRQTSTSPQQKPLKRSTQEIESLVANTSHAVEEAGAKRAFFELQPSPSASPEDLSLGLAQLLNHHSTDLFPFKMHARVGRGQTAGSSLSKFLGKESCALESSQERKMIQLGNFSQVADLFWQRGVALTYETPHTNSRSTHFILPAELTIDRNAQWGCVLWTVDDQGVCFDKAFYVTPQSSFVSRFAKRAFSHADFPPPAQPPSLESTDEARTPEEYNLHETNVIIDDLLHCATIRKEKSGTFVSLPLFLEPIA